MVMRKKWTHRLLSLILVGLICFLSMPRPILASTSDFPGRLTMTIKDGADAAVADAQVRISVSGAASPIADFTAQSNRNGAVDLGSISSTAIQSQNPGGFTVNYTVSFGTESVSGSFKVGTGAAGDYGWTDNRDVTLELPTATAVFVIRDPFGHALPNAEISLTGYRITGAKTAFSDSSGRVEIPELYFMRDYTYTIKSAQYKPRTGSYNWSLASQVFQFMSTDLKSAQNCQVNLDGVAAANKTVVIDAGSLALDISGFEVSSGEVTCTSSNPNIAMVAVISESANTKRFALTLTGVGPTTIAVTAASNDQHLAFTTSFTLTVQAGTIDPSLFPFQQHLFSGVYDGQPHSILTDLSPFSSDYSYRYSLDNVTFQSAVPEITNAGDYSLYVEIGKPNYTTRTLGPFPTTIRRATQPRLDFTSSFPATITFQYDSGTGVNPNTYFIVAQQNGRTPETVRYKINGDASVAEIDDRTGRLTVLKPGNVQVEAYIEDPNYDRVFVSQPININKGEQNLFVFATPTPGLFTYGTNGNRFSNIASGPEVTGNVQYSITSQTRNGSPVSGLERVADISSNGMLTILADGEITVSARKAGNDRFNDRTITYHLTVSYQPIPNEKPRIAGQKVNGWYNTPVTITAPTGYTVSLNNRPEDIWNSSITVSQDGETRNFSVYLKSNDTQGITDKVFLRDFIGSGGDADLKVDRTKPGEAPGEINVTISDAVQQSSIIDELLRTITFGFYNPKPPENRPLVVTVKATDNLSGVESVTCSYNGTDTPMPLVDVNQHQYQLTAPPEFRGNINIKVKDIAGNERDVSSMNEFRALLEKTYVVDTVAPQFSITYSPQMQWYQPGAAGTPMTPQSNAINAGTVAYFQNNTGGDKLATISIQEDNFFEGDYEYIGNVSSKIRDVKVTLIKQGDGTVPSEIVQVVQWNKTGSNTYTTDIPLPVDDGNYRISVSYTDRSGNKMNYKNDYDSTLYSDGTYTSNPIRVDRTKALGKMTLNPPSYEGTDTWYYNAPVTVTLEILETYFDNPEDVDVKIFAYGTNNVVETIPANRLQWSAANASGWRTATFAPDCLNAQQAARDGTYQIAFHYTDLSNNTMDPCLSGKILMDTTAPELRVSYEAAVRSVDGSTLAEIDPIAVTDRNTRLYYNAPTVATLRITEANFLEGDDVIVLLEKKDNNGTVTRTRFMTARASNLIPYPDPTDKQMITWTPGGGNAEYTLQIPLGDDGEYRLTVAYTDKSGNPMNFAFDDGTPGTKEYTSNLRILDMTKPTMSVAYLDEQNNPAIPLNGENYKQDIYAKITITERNFRKNEIAVSLTAVDIPGNGIGGMEDYTQTLRQANWTDGPGDTHTATIKFSTDARYELQIAYEDLARNTLASDYRHEFVVDHAPPQNLAILYSAPKNDRDGIKYYNDNAGVTLSAEDSISGIHTFTYSYKGDAPYTGSAYQSLLDQTVTPSVSGKNGQFSFPIPPQFRGKVSFTATDKSGNESALTGQTIVVDSIKPSAKISLSPSRVVNAGVDRDNSAPHNGQSGSDILYFNADAKIAVTITEANFFKEDVVLEVKNLDTGLTNRIDTTRLNWQSQGDVCSTDIQLLGDSGHWADGDYQLLIHYEDRSTNQMTPLASDRIVIDRTNPVIQVTYPTENAANTVDGRTYYNAVQTVIITITERNFRPDDVYATVTAKDVAGINVVVNDYAGYLRGANWSKNGDVYTARIVYATDANYTFAIAYTDLATNVSDPYDEDLFTVDQTAPYGLSISYSTSLLDTVINAVSFGFYNARTTVTISAYDDTTGIQDFLYNCKTSLGASSINTQILNAAISKANINYSDGGRKASASFTVPGNALTGSNQFRGSVDFNAQDIAKNKTQHANPKVIVVDNIAPVATVTLNNPVKQKDGIKYYAGDVVATIRIQEANFFKEDVKISVSKNGGSAYPVAPGNWSQSGDIWTGSIQLSAPVNHTGDGTYIITMDYTDKSANRMMQYVSDQLIIDTTQPELLVTNLKYQSANKANKIGFTLTASDTNIDTEAFVPELSVLTRDAAGAFTTKILDCGNRKVIEAGKTYSYTIDNLDADGIYNLSCSVSDLAGNRYSQLKLTDDGQHEYEKVEFSINRYGSTFKLDQETQKAVSDYFVQSLLHNVEITEINVDPLLESKIQINKNDLEKGKDCEVNKTGGNGQWNQYVYTIDQPWFNPEGDYSVVVFSKDKAQTIAYSDIKGLDVSFVIDKTPPQVTVSGLETGGRYQVASQKVTMVPKDDGGRLQAMKVTVRNRAGTASTLVDTAGNNFLDALEQNEKISFDIPDGMNQNVLIECTDAAGNVYKQEYRQVTVSTRWYILFFANKPLFLGSIIGAACVLTGLIVLLILVKRRRKKENGAPASK